LTTLPLTIPSACRGLAGTSDNDATHQVVLMINVELEGSDSAVRVGFEGVAGRGITESDTVRGVPGYFLFHISRSRRCVHTWTVCVFELFW
jgi:hypothetical protein